MDKGYHTNKTILSNYKPPFTVDWSRFKNRHWTDAADTRVPLALLKSVAQKATAVPENFKLHPRVEKVMADRRAMAEGKIPIDWGMGEILAYATLVGQGFGVRISGEDVGRGTFAHRHVVLHDQNREKWDSGTWIPLQHIKEGQPDFEIIDSVLTESAVVGFEYGYTTSEPNQLVIWEAQFGDFANGAQVVIDQFISSGEVKWGRICGLVMLLPHGYEGQGPEHSSARPERYLQLCAQHNMQVCVPSTPAQIYHLLRRQMVRDYRKPLIVMSPKSLLRHKEAVSSLEELADGMFHTVIPEIDKIDPKKVRRVVVCSGKVYYELLAYRRERKIDDIAILRLEQQYPFPHEDYKIEVARYTSANEVVWCQEEPQNQGAWYRLRAMLRADIDAEKVLAYAGRSVSAAPAVGYAAKHNAEQRKLIEDAFTEKLHSGEMVLAR
jgi:2-oxoglutarate dehydrogenase E1 component